MGHRAPGIGLLLTTAASRPCRHPSGTVHAIAGDGRGGVWVSSFDQGVAHVVGGNVVERMTFLESGGGMGGSGLVPDSNGGVWIALIRGALVHFRGGRRACGRHRVVARGSPRPASHRRGKANREIATHLAATEDAIKNHVKSICRSWMPTIAHTPS